MNTWNHGDIEPTRCILRPRQTHQGRQVKPQVLAHAGEQFALVPLWEMDDSDGYPGEWALGTPDGSMLDKLGVAWIASGDVEVLQ